MFMSILISTKTGAFELKKDKDGIIKIIDKNNHAEHKEITQSNKRTYR